MNAKKCKALRRLVRAFGHNPAAAGHAAYRRAKKLSRH